jgi:hypothetical protein
VLQLIIIGHCLIEFTPYAAIRFDVFSVAADFARTVHADLHRLSAHRGSVLLMLPDDASREDVVPLRTALDWIACRCNIGCFSECDVKFRPLDQRRCQCWTIGAPAQFHQAGTRLLLITVILAFPRRHSGVKAPRSIRWPI